MTPRLALAIVFPAVAACAAEEVAYTLPRLVIHGADGQGIAALQLRAALADDGHLTPIDGGAFVYACPCPDPLSFDVDVSVDGVDSFQMAIVARDVEGRAVRRHVGVLALTVGLHDVTLDAPACEDGDHDGFCADDPAPWTDMDDDDASRTPLNPPAPQEVCDGADDDGDGLADEGTLGFGAAAAIVSIGEDWADVRLGATRADRRVGAWTRAPTSGEGRCVRAMLGKQPPATDCTILADKSNLLPRQPAVDVDTNALVAWIRTSGCARGIPVVTTASSVDAANGAAELDLAGPCTAGAGAAMPSIAISPGDPARALVAWRAESVETAVDPLSSGCAGAVAAPVEIRLLDMVKGIGVSWSGSLGASLGSRAPAVLGLPMAGDPFVVGAAADTGGAGLFVVEGEGQGLDAPALTVPGLPEGPTGVVLAPGDIDGAKVTVGVGLEVGCAPQRAWFAEATFDLKSGERAITPAIELDTGGERASYVSPSWSPVRREWLVVWSGPTIKAQRVRVTAGVATLQDATAIRLGPNGSYQSLAVAGSAGSGGPWSVSYHVAGDGGGLFEATFGCLAP